MGWFSDPFGRKQAAQLKAQVKALRETVSLALRARYDASITHDENKSLWTNVDLLSAKAANSFSVRETLRTRSRYERANNPYCLGISHTLATDLIGCGPRLQSRLTDRAANKQIETAFANWADAINLAEKLRTMKLAKITDGEAFALFVTNPNINNPVQLDLRLIEADQVRTPALGFYDSSWIDGLTLDSYGNVESYNVLRGHPGDLFVPNMTPLAFDKWPARLVIHWFRTDRPGQVRGIPEFTPALELFGKLRRFRDSVLAAAETAADFAAIIKSMAPPDDSSNGADSGGSVGQGLFPTFQLQKAMMTFLPDGYDALQLKPEQPSTTFEMFVRILLREVARCIGIPLGLALGDASGSNFSSIRTENLPYYRAQKVERQQCEAVAVDRIFAAWLDEAVMIPGILPVGIADASNVPHQWIWPASDSIDPVKDATATQLQMQNGTTTLEDELAKAGSGVDWEDHILQLGREAAAKKAAGLTPEPTTAQNSTSNDDSQIDSTDGTDEQKVGQEAAATA